MLERIKLQKELKMVPFNYKSCWVEKTVFGNICK
jgi:hypothetical protein